MGGWELTEEAIVIAITHAFSATLAEMGIKEPEKKKWFEIMSKHTKYNLKKIGELHL